MSKCKVLSRSLKQGLHEPIGQSLHIERTHILTNKRHERRVRSAVGAGVAVLAAAGRAAGAVAALGREGRRALEGRRARLRRARPLP
jgi:hypothetical protein